MTATPDRSLRLGISAYLLGQKVRFDGGHKRDSFLVDTFGRFVDWVPVCPEEEAGFGTPRPSMRLVAEPGTSGADGAALIRLRTVRTGVDLTEPMRRYTAGRVTDIAGMDLDGYVLKKDSPSCGLMRVKVYTPEGPGVRTGRGIFADALCRALPLLPVEEEGRLGDPRLRENFVERVFAYRRLRDFTSARPKAGDLVRFHTAHKLLLLAHAPTAYAELGRLVARARGVLPKALLDEYGNGFMTALGTMASRGRHVNVLQHMAGYFKRVADEASRQHLSDAIADYQQGLIPIIVPITLISHYAKLHQVAYLLEQVYLQPHPKELMLRNHV
jgi:uncharacterized protein YbgA (DUF1722 family)/uncharacterized protein YbbK (DUF523 family)